MPARVCWWLRRLSRVGCVHVFTCWRFVGKVGCVIKSILGTLCVGGAGYGVGCGRMEAGAFRCGCVEHFKDGAASGNKCLGRMGRLAQCLQLVG